MESKVMAKVLLSVKNLTTQFGQGEQATKVVNNVSFDIKPGETFALVGESGSGKSMTAFSIMRLLPSAGRITSGEVNYADENLLSLTEADMRRVRGSGVSMIFQEPMTSLNPVMTIAEQIMEAIFNCQPDTTSDDAKTQAIELLELVGIKEAQRRSMEYPHQFSGGMRQRVMIAMALAGEPELLIADEPTTALDVTIQAQVLELIQQIQKKRKMAVLLITHDLGVVHQMADRVAVMRRGEILETSKSSLFFSKPKHDYSKKLFESIPSIAKRGKALSTVDGKQTARVKRNSKTPDKPLLTVNQLKTYFPITKGVFKRTVGYVQAVDGVSLAIPQGKTLALVGESGSGKSTLAKTIIRLLKPHAGSIKFDGKDLSKLNYQQMRALRTDLQIVFQDPYSSMNPRMLVRDILAEGMKALNIYKTEQQRVDRMQELLELTGLPKNSLNRYPHQFSGGQRQRISIARALAVDPKLIVCDEPTSALDVSVQAQILNLLKDLQNRLGLSYLFITHNISVVAYIADEVAVMYNGKIVEHGNVEDIILKPENDYTKKLMSAVPELYKLKA